MQISQVLQKKVYISKQPQSSACQVTILTAWFPSRLFGAVLCLVGGQSLLHWPVQGGRKTIHQLNFKLHENPPPPILSTHRAHKPKPMIFCFN